jgi:DNA-binding transcriptional LysR family regulator
MPGNGAFLDQFKWDDLRVALALARAGSVRKAARDLGVSHSTILRRLHALEQAAGVRLFEPRPDGYEVTPAGQDVFDTAVELEETVIGLQRRVAGSDLRLSGPVRVTLPDPFAPVLVPILGDFSRAHPGIDVTLLLGTVFVDMAHREADVAVRVAPDPPPDLIGHRVCMAGVGIYGSRSYLEGRSARRLDELDWVGWAGDSQMFFARWTRDNVPPERIVLRVSAGWGLREALDADTGVAIVPCALGENRRNWKRIDLLPDAAAPLWVLTHRDLRTTARVRVLRDFLVDALRERRAAIEGRARPRPVSTGHGPAT